MHKWKSMAAFMLTLLLLHYAYYVDFSLNEMIVPMKTRNWQTKNYSYYLRDWQSSEVPNTVSKLKA